MSLNLDNVNPYRIFIREEVNKTYLTPYLCLSMAGVIRQNNSYRKDTPAHLWFDMLEFRFEPASTDWYSSAPYNMGGLVKALNALPSKEPWPKGLTPFLISYFGNSAKKKLAELATPEALYQWMKACPLEVLGFLGCYCPPTRSDEEVAKAREALKPRTFVAPPPAVEYTPVAEEPKKKRSGPAATTIITPPWLEEATAITTGPTMPRSTMPDLEGIATILDAATPNEAPRQ